MVGLAQMIKDIVQRFNDWYDEYDRFMIEWRDTDPEAYFNYMITKQEV